MPKLLPSLALSLLVLATPVAAQDPVDKATIAKMDSRQLLQLVGAITTSVGQDSLKLQSAAQRNDCLELTRAANSFALGYTMLADVDAATEGRPAQEAARVKLQVVQSRVITFASRVKAEEYHSRRCASYVIPAEQADEPRYAKPAKIQVAEYSRAIVEARHAAEANLAVAIAAGRSKKCPEVLGAMQSIQLLVPYLEKLSRDVGKRPQVLGPQASRRGLEVARAQLISAGNAIYRQVGVGCAGASPPVQAEEEKTPPADAPTDSAPGEGSPAIAP